MILFDALENHLSFQGVDADIQLSTARLEPGIYLLRCTMDDYSGVLRLMVLKP